MRLRPILNIAVLVQDLEQPFCPGQSVLHRGLRAGEMLEGLIDQQHGRQKRHKFALGALSLNNA